MCYRFSACAYRKGNYIEDTVVQQSLLVYVVYAGYMCLKLYVL